MSRNAGTFSYSYSSSLVRTDFAFQIVNKMTQWWFVTEELCNQGND